MANIFLDLGTHYGQGLREFIHLYRMDQSWKIRTYEANPVTRDIFLNNYHHLTPWVQSFLEAISDHNGILTVHLETPPGEGDTGMGTSVIDLEQWNPWGLQDRGHFQNHVDVPCVDLSEIIINNYEKTDFIVVKMDIEGSEYDTLDRLIETGAIEYIDDLYVEWHSRFFNNKEEVEQREKALIDKINQYNIKLESWK